MCVYMSERGCGVFKHGSTCMSDLFKNKQIFHLIVLMLTWVLQ